MSLMLKLVAILVMVNAALIGAVQLFTGEAFQNHVLSVSIDGEIYVMDLLHGDTANITDSPIREHAQMWSPDGRRLAYLVFYEDRAATSMGIYDTETQQTTQYPIGTANYEWEWSPNGQYISAISTEETDDGPRFRLFLIDVVEATVDSMIYSHMRSDHVWTADSASVIHSAFGQSNFKGLLVEVDLASGESSIIHQNLFEVGVFQFAPNGRDLLVAQDLTYTKNPRTLILDTDSGRNRSLINDAGWAHWSGDGQYVTVNHTIVHVETHQVTATLPPDRLPTWSPVDAVLLQVRGADRRLYTYKVVTDETVYVDSDLAEVPRWSPDGRYIAYSTATNPEESQLNIYELATGQVVTRRLPGEPLQWIDWRP